MMVGAGWAILAWREAWRRSYEEYASWARLNGHVLVARNGDEWFKQFGSPRIPEKRPARGMTDEPDDVYARLYDSAQSWVMQHQAQLIEAWNEKNRDRLSGITSFHVGREDREALACIGLEVVVKR